MSAIHRKVIERVINELFNQDRYELLDELYTDDVEMCNAGSDTSPPSRTAIIERHRFFRQAFPDLRYEIKHCLCEGDAAAVRWVARGTHTGPLGDCEPSGKPFTIEGMAFLEFHEGRIAHIWQQADFLRLLDQLGVPRENLQQEYAA